MSAAAALELHIDGRPSGVRVRTALRWWTRAVGLLATPQLDDPSGLWIAPCNSVHTFGMRYPIDVVFVDAEGSVTKTVPNLAPGRAAWGRAKSVVELRAGLIVSLGISCGTRVELGGSKNAICANK